RHQIERLIIEEGAYTAVDRHLVLPSVFKYFKDHGHEPWTNILGSWHMLSGELIHVHDP
ncbi:hypothetical protein L195_g063570, partial [Trifolium pratense]